jgi:hypothetical protein
MTRALPFRCKLVACLVPLLTASAITAQEDDEEAFDRTPQDCIRTASIDSTDAVDDQNLIFRMDGRAVYRNHLPRKCPGLERENRFSYETRSGRLCSIDTITVLEQFGVGFRPGFTCRLGEFVPLSPEEIEDLEVREEGGRPRQSVIEAKPVELESPAPADAAEEAAPDEASDADESAAPEGDD